MIGAAQMAPISFSLASNSLSSSWMRGSELRLSVPGCPPGRTIMSNAAALIESRVASGMMLILRALLTAPSWSPARTTSISALLNMSTTANASISSKPSASGIRTFDMFTSSSVRILRYYRNTLKNQAIMCFVIAFNGCRPPFLRSPAIFAAST